MSAPTAAMQLKRVLTIIPLIADGEEHSIEQIAQLAGMDRQQLVADLNSVSARFDLPGGWVDGVSILVDRDNVSVVASHFLRPMRLTMPELCALELGLGLIQRERTADDLPAIQRASERLRAVITKLPREEHFDRLRAAELSSAGDAAHLATIRGALRGRKKVRLRYRSGSKAASAERVVCPYGLVHSAGSWYVVAHCEGGEGIRFFRLDRVEDATQLSESFRRAPDFDLARIAGDRPFAGTPDKTMTVRYSPRIARWICEREGGTLASDGSLTRDYPLGDMGWAVRHVLQYGPDAEAIAPEELRQEIVRRLDAISA